MGQSLKIDQKSYYEQGSKLLAFKNRTLHVFN